ncbi:MAG TPA: hypothetical protein VGM03_16060 [Phycisphaerae bacterium]|jgi:hypothetical protein
MRTRKLQKPMNPRLPGRYGRMTADEWDREVAIFDREFIADTARPMTADERAEELAARRKRASPRARTAAKRVVVTIQPSLLRRTDSYARKHRMTRAALIARALEAVVGKAG